MAKRKWAGTPAQKAALRKAQLASARARKSRRNTNRRHYSSNPAKRGVGAAGLRQNATPYVRLNRSSGTVGANTGTVIPFTGKRVVAGGYLRLENISRKNDPIGKAQRKVANRLARPGTKPGAVRKWFNENVYVQNPAVRVNAGGAQVRLGTSRRAGATIIVRKGRHKAMQSKSVAGVRKYDRNVNTITKSKAPKTRRARRGR